MGALYQIQLKTINPCSVDLVVTPVQPDCCPFYTSRRFALGLLKDAPSGRCLTRSIPRRAEMVGRAWASFLLQRPHLFDHKVHASFYPSIHPLREALPQSVGEDLGSSGFDASPFVASVEIIELSTDTWDYDMPAPTATYRIEVTRRKWLDHLRDPANTSWDSTAYDHDDAPYIDLMSTG